MNDHRLLKVGDSGPLGLVREVLYEVWDVESLESIYVPVWTPENPTPQLRWLFDKNEIKNADPFAPFMERNHAGEVLACLIEEEKHKVGIFLHPCEVRSLHIIAEDAGVDLVNQFLISSDCLAVYESDDFAFRSSEHERGVVTQETLRFARLGGILPSRYRIGCQLCERPFAENLDLYFELFGLQTSEHIGVSLRTRASIDAIEARFSVEDVPDEVISRRREVLSKLVSWRSRSIEETEEKLDVEISTLDALSAHLAECTSCHARLLAHCPSSPCTGPRSDIPDRKDLTSWLSTCGGCGLCEYECPDAFPLFGVILTLRKKLEAAQA